MSSCNIDRTGLDNILKKVKAKLKNVDNLKEKIKDIGIEEFNNAYKSDSDFSGIEITGEIRDEEIIITAHDLKGDVDIAFIEFGTGGYGLDYEGRLPKQTITFTVEGSGRVGSTAGWEYFYDSPAKRRNGWYLPKMKGGYFDTCIGAHNTFYRACKKIKQRIKEELN